MCFKTEVIFLREGEELLSEIYIIGTNDRECRRSLELILPIRSRPYENMYETDVIMRAPDHDSWQSIDFDQDVSVAVTSRLSYICH